MLFRPFRPGPRCHLQPGAICWLRINAATYGIDPARVATWGASAGGRLAALAGTSCGMAELMIGLEPEGAATPESAKVYDCVQADVTWRV